MTPTERATNLIQRIERLFERATKAPWSVKGWGIYCPNCIKVASVPHDNDRPLIVTIRNVGLEGIVGPIRRHMSMYSACCLVNHEVAGLCDKCEQHILAIGEWCDIWEPS